MLEVITMSSKGQFVVPRGIREEMGLKKQDRFVLMNDKDSIVLKRIKTEDTIAEMNKIMTKMAKQFKKQKITKQDVEKEIKEVRKNASRP